MRPLLILPFALLLPAAVSAKDPPRTLFISPMGEPFRTEDGKPEVPWFVRADKDGDGGISLTEFVIDAARFFTALDLNHDGALSPDEVHRYETEVAPELQASGFEGDGDFAGGRPADRGGGHSDGRPGGDFGGGARRGGPGGGHRDAGMRGGNRGGGGSGGALEGAGRYGYIDTAEPVTAADSDRSGIITRAEFLSAAQHRFELLDSGQHGTLVPRDLPRLKANPHRPRVPSRTPPPDGAGLSSAGD